MLKLCTTHQKEKEDCVISQSTHWSVRQINYSDIESGEDLDSGQHVPASALACCLLSSTLLYIHWVQNANIEVQDVLQVGGNEEELKTTSPAMRKRLKSKVICVTTQYQPALTPVVQRVRIMVRFFGILTAMNQVDEVNDPNPRGRGPA